MLANFVYMKSGLKICRQFIPSPPIASLFLKAFSRLNWNCVCGEKMMLSVLFLSLSAMSSSKAYQRKQWPIQHDKAMQSSSRGKMHDLLLAQIGFLSYLTCILR